MKLKQLTFTLILICCAAVGFTFSQKKPSKEKNGRSEQKTIEVKANLMVLDAENKFVDDVKAEEVKIFEDGIEQKITYFAKRPETLNLGIIFDNSGSMRFALNEIIQLGKSIVSNLQENDEAFAARFVDSDKIEMIEEWTSNQTKLRAALEEMYIEGGQSAIIDAIYLAGEKLSEREKKDKSKKYALVVISDGEDRDSFYKYDEMLSLFKNTDIQIFMISYAFQAPLKPKAAAKFGGKITFDTGGRLINLTKKRNTEDINAALKTLITELRSNYIFGYISTNQKSDGNARNLRVEIADGKNGRKRNVIVRQTIIPVE